MCLNGQGKKTNFSCSGSKTRQPDSSNRTGQAGTEAGHAASPVHRWDQDHRCFPASHEGGFLGYSGLSKHEEWWTQRRRWAFLSWQPEASCEHTETVQTAGGKIWVTLIAFNVRETKKDKKYSLPQKCYIIAAPVLWPWLLKLGYVKKKRIPLWCTVANVWQFFLIKDRK